MSRLPTCVAAAAAEGRRFGKGEWPLSTNSSQKEKEVLSLKFLTLRRCSAAQDGGGLHWRNGDVGGKCGGCPPGSKGCTPMEPTLPTAVRGYAWVYTWPLDPATGPAPNTPPIKYVVCACGGVACAFLFKGWEAKEKGRRRGSCFFLLTAESAEESTAFARARASSTLRSCMPAC